MNVGPGPLLIAALAALGVLHVIIPDRRMSILRMAHQVQQASRRSVTLAYWLLAPIAVLASAQSAHAHGIAGNRFFPGTMTFDDPAVADEFLILQSGSKHPLDEQSGFNVLDNVTAWSFARLLTSDLSIGVNSGWIHRSGDRFPTQSGFDQTSITLKHLLYKNELHEVLISGSLSWGIGGSGAQRPMARSARHAEQFSAWLVELLLPRDAPIGIPRR